MISKKDEEYMALAISEAKRALGRTSPNPCVGAVIVKDGKVIATGFHKKAGTPHAEIHALQAAGDSAVGATMYVTLEPCNHTGKTPPCSHAVAKAGIAKVVVGMEDPNPLVDGTGITYLKENNIEVVSGVLEKECRDINRPFLKYISTGLPWTVMKAGISLDGKLNYQKGRSGWITGKESGTMVHHLRNIYDAILIGSATAKIDNPSLTTRLSGVEGRDPIRVILDRTLSIDLQAKIFNLESPAPTWIFCAHTAENEKILALESLGVRVLKVSCNKDQLDLHEVLRVLADNGVTSVLVEGGAAIHGSMLNKHLYDYANLFVAPVFAGSEGVSLVSGYSTDCKEHAVTLADVEYDRLGEDIMISGEFVYR